MSAAHKTLIAASLIVSATAATSMALANTANDVLGATFAALQVNEADACVDNQLTPLVSNWVATAHPQAGEEKFMNAFLVEDALAACEANGTRSTEYRSKGFDQGFTVRFDGMTTIKVGNATFYSPKGEKQIAFVI
ncbi:MAG TPA: hypothetical protein VIN59_02300 [Alphaproteobacteria bacterium]